MKLNHVYNSQTEEQEREQAKFIAVALRGEEALRELVAPAYAHHSDMSKLMYNTQLFREHDAAAAAKKLDKKTNGKKRSNQREGEDKENKKGHSGNTNSERASLGSDGHPKKKGLMTKTAEEAAKLIVESMEDEEERNEEIPAIFDK